MNASSPQPDATSPPSTVRHSLNRRLFVITIASNIGIGLLSLLLLFFIAYQNDLRDSQVQTAQLMDAVEYSASVASFSSNSDIANDVIKGLLRSQNVCAARLYNKEGLNFIQHKNNAAENCPDVLSRILYSPFDEKEIVGHLDVQLDTPSITKRAYQHAAWLALSLCALILLPGFIIWLAVSRYITVPIHHLSVQLHTTLPGSAARIQAFDDDATSEVAQLSGDMNHLLDIVEKTLNAEREQHEIIVQLKQKFEHLAHHDVLTGLPNRLLLNDRLHIMLAQALRNQNQAALMFLDLDKFKPINDTLGHDVGDLLLQKVAQRLLAAVRTSDSVARIGGDEFVVLLPEISNPHGAQLVAEKIRQQLSMPFLINGHTLSIGASIGMAIYPEHGDNATELTKNADIAMYLAKANGRNNVQLYRPTMNLPSELAAPLDGSN